MRKIVFLSIFSAVLALFSWASSAPQAATSTHVMTDGAWSLYTFDEKGGKVCFITANPASAKGNYTKRGEIFAMVSERPAEKARNVFSYRAGYAYDLKAPISLMIDGKSFNLYSSSATPETAWAATQADDDAITAALGKGKTMVVKGRSARGADTTDSFSINGFAKAFQTSQAACAPAPAAAAPAAKPEAKN